MAKLRVYQLASQYDIPSREFVQILNRFEIPVKNHMSALTDQQVENFKKQFDPEKDRRTEEQTPAKKKKVPSKKTSAAKEEAKTASQKSKQVPKQKIKQSHADHSEKAQGADKKRTEKKKTADIKQKSAKPKQSGPQEHASGLKKKNGAEALPKQNGENKKNRKKKNKKDRANRQNEPALKVKDHSKKGKTSHAVYKKKKDEKKTEQAKNKVYAIPENITVSELAETLDVAATEIIKILMLAGTMATINQRIDFDTAQLVCDELGYEVEAVKVEDVFEKMLEEYDEEETGNEEIRPPVVTVMGHVDHGKTSLLDRIRKSHVTAGEAGGITQHIGAYTVKIQGKSITFIDTPGHAAFTAMRSRGAQMTDIAVLVVAADDGVMPQTIEAINHAKAAKVPIIVAINKIDKEGANPERVKQELVDQGVIVEEWGGDVIAVPVSAKKGKNIDELLENILLVAEIEELKADPDRPARGCVIEARVKKGKGSTASILVQQGTLHLGDAILSGTTYGRVRTMVDDKGRRIKKAGPSRPVEISGLSGTPEAGDDFIVMPSDKEARQMAEQRLEQEKNNRQAKAKVSLDDLFSRIQEGDVKDINLIVKADVQGSVEALSQSLQKLSNDEVKVNVIHGAVGAVNESDVLLATTSDAIIIGFNVRPDKNALAAAENEKIDIHLYRVIYDAIDDVKKAMEGLLDPEFVEKVTGDAEVRSTFRIPGGVIIAGAYVTDGKISRSDEVRVARDGIVVFEGKIASLRRFKDDVKEVNQGYECGIGIENYNDIKEGDVIETFVNEAVKREL
ncbi:translation initiation factor IF-2 [Pseudoramibacter alactolyticus ATCC 23263]|uniref:Translation initiation factor IF-2 n=1 Tax=Pseudoramibacter alactolyticus ATCC 23263 TaxID=887929 RepID=E6MF50_9FIRM|nr:translation initiation factor IF-2 [Pseudoramibacter alactolyticus]EFV02210.1 translation initiation factor IF-2 [Pseudoramibacter alactolyticus ATCC 23263]